MRHAQPWPPGRLPAWLPTCPPSRFGYVGRPVAEPRCRLAEDRPRPALEGALEGLAAGMLSKALRYGTRRDATLHRAIR